jgi:lipoic acid synthetase
MENLIPTKTIKENGVVAIKNGMKPNSNKLIPIERKPTWLKVKSQNSRKFKELKRIVSVKKLHTVCEEAMCPNIQECWSHGTATFMLLANFVLLILETPRGN